MIMKKNGIRPILLFCLTTLSPLFWVEAASTITVTATGLGILDCHQDAKLSANISNYDFH